MTLTARQEHLVSLFLVAPAFVYLGGLLIGGYTGWNGSVVAGFVIIPLLIVIGLIPLWGPFIELLGFVGLTLSVVWATATSPGGVAGVDFMAGILLASPFLLGSWAWTPNRSAPARLLGLGLALLEGIILLAALRLLQTNGQVENSAFLFYNYVAVNLLQACGITGFLNVVPTGCPTDLTILPLRDLVDPVFVLLAGLALLGVLMPILSPRTARGAPGDAESFDEFESAARVRADVPLTAEMMRGLASRTPPRPSPSLAPPGTGALLLAAGIVLLFVAAAVSAPTVLLLPTMLLLFFSLGGVLTVSRRPHPPVARFEGREPPFVARGAGVPLGAPALASTRPSGALGPGGGIAAALPPSLP